MRRLGVPETAFIVCTLSVFSVPSAHAQQAYVGGALLVDIVRFSASSGEANGEAFGGALRVGTSIGERWGVDLEFVRPAEVEWDPGDPIFFPFSPSGTQLSLGGRLLGGGDVRRLGQLFPQIVTSSASYRHTTLSPTLWVRQSIGDNVELMYLGGAAFARVSQTSVFRIAGDLPIEIPGAIRGQVVDGEAIQYEVGPTVGVDTRIRMTDHLRLVAGVRLLAIDSTFRSAWLTRPSVGLHWVF
jgi:hypothetical protein